MRLGRMLSRWVGTIGLSLLAGAGLGTGRAGAGEALGPPVGLGETGRGALLVKTDVPGRFQEAPLLRTDVRMQVTGLVARVEVAQQFANPTEEWLEAIYVFPLPESAAVDTLLVRVGPRVIEGRIREREEARQTYQQAKQEGKKASLLEQERPNIFTVSVANIGPGEQVEVILQYQELLRYDGGEFRLRFPMVVGPRYIPGAIAVAGDPGTGWGINTDAVPDAARITPPVRHPRQGPINPVTLAVDLDTGFPLRRVESPFHAVVATPVSPTRQLVTLRDGEVPADRDFELVWAPAVGHEPAAAVFTQWHDGEHYALVMLLPPPADAAGARLPRETVVVVDTSGSMAGASIEQARLALGEALGALRPGDRFNLIQFNSRTQALFPSTVPAGPAELARARQWVAGLRADGGTEMLSALRAALEEDAGHDAVRQVVFITDGQVGNEDQLFRYIQEKLGRSRLFTVGIGASPNSHFMTKAAEFGRGTYTYIGSPTEVGEKMTALFRKLEHPVLAGLAVSWDRHDVEAWPERIPDLYLGEPIVLVARLGTDPRSELTFTGTRGAQPWEVALRLDARTDETGIHKLWARKKIGSLMDRLREGADRDEVRGAVVAVALQHHLVSAYTSLVAVDVTPTRPDGTPLATGIVPTNLPAGAEHEKIFGGLPRTATPGPLYLVLGLMCLGLALGVRRWALATARSGAAR
jgi:Ca-activated chloride channel homolog